MPARETLHFGHETGAAAARRRRGGALLALMPVVAIVLLLASMALLLWLAMRNDAARQRSQLLSDALWVEQAFRFQLATDDDSIARLALGAADSRPGTSSFLDQARVFLANNPEVIALALRDGAGQPRAVLPASPGRPAPPRAVAAQLLSLLSVRPVYGPPRRLADGTVVVDVTAATPGGARGEAGAVSATLSLSALVARQVPWWIAARYAVRLLDASGAVLAEKARAGRLDPGGFYQMSLGTPLAGTYVAVAAYPAQGPGHPNLLVAAIGGLAVFAVVSLLLLQRHAARGRRIEARLSTEMAFRRAMEASLTVGMRARDNQGRILYVNPAFCRMVGYSAEELVGRAPPMPYWPADQISETQARHDARIAGERKAHSYESHFRRRDGSGFDVLLYEAPLVDLDGVDRGWMGSIIDITDRKASAELARLQGASLQRTARLIALGEMASTLAHELNQPLASIVSYAAGSLNILRAQEHAPALVVAAIEKLAAQAERAGRVVRRSQDFVRKRAPRFAPVAVAELIDDVIGFAALDARDGGAVFERDIAAALPCVQADRTLLEQLLLNLVKNAWEAGAPVVTLGAARAGDEVVIAVADRGAGIGPDIAGRLFDAFVTSKPDGLGMGLGICRSIAELHSGRLAHAPRPGGGTVFSLALPIAGPAAQTAQAA